MRNRFTKPSKEKPFPVGMASSPSKTNLFRLRARKAATISGKPEVRLLLVLDCKKRFSSSRKIRQRNPSHFGSYIHSLPMGKLFTARAFIGLIGGLRNLSSELSEVTTRNGIYFLLACFGVTPDLSLFAEETLRICGFALLLIAK